MWVHDGRVNSFADANIGGPSCTIVRAAVVEDICRFDESFPAVEDSDFWIRLFSPLPHDRPRCVLYERRLQDGQMTNDPELMLAGCQKLVEKHGETLTATGRARCHYSIGHHHARLDRTAIARSHLRTAIQSDPWQLAFHYFHFWLLFGTLATPADRQPGDGYFGPSSKSLGKAVSSRPSSTTRHRTVGSSTV